MDGSLLDDISANELLAKFGAGGHKPGSGSAAALQGLLSAQLMRTVIELTLDHRRRAPYAQHLPRLNEIKTRIERAHYPALERLLYEDAAQFDKVISFRQLARDETDLASKAEYASDARHALKRATEIPVEIAQHSIELCHFACTVFDLGFRAARGDSGVALNSALSAIAGCISIIDLNLLSFEASSWTGEIRSRTLLLREQLHALKQASQERQETLERESEHKDRFSRELSNIVALGKGAKNLRDEDIEGIAIQLQQSIWNHGDVVWKNGPPSNPIDALDPVKALQLLGFHVQSVPTLGQYRINGSTAEVAGQIEQTRRLVWVSEQFLKPTQRFTAAHELGHALLHRQNVMHRDPPVDGSGDQTRRSSTEIQANRFAALFLMPRKLTLSSFVSLFGTQRIVISEDTAFNLRRPSPAILRKECRNLRGFARLLASAEYYEGRHFDSLASRFGVSVEALAIRLEELELLEF